MKRWGAAGAAVVLLLTLAGCSAGPSSEEVQERFLIEYEGIANVQTEGGYYFTELAETAAQEAAAGKCGDDAYYSTLKWEVEYAFGVMCTMYYEGDMSTEQVDRVKHQLLDQIKEDYTP